MATVTTLAIAMLAACGTAPIAPPATVATAPEVIATAPPASAPIEIPAIAVAADGHEGHRGGGMYVFTQPALDLLEPPAGATLAPDPVLARQLAALVAARAAAFARLTRARDALRATPVPKRGPARAVVDLAETVLAEARTRLIVALDAALGKLAQDGVVLDALLRVQRDRDRDDDAVEHHLDTDPDGPEPLADDRDAIAAIASATARGLDPAHQGVVDFLRTYLDAQHPDPAIRHAAALAMLPLARSTPAVTAAAYTIAGHILFGGARDDTAAVVEAFRWLADHAARPDERGYARYLLGHTQRVAGDPAAIDTLCAIAPPLEPVLVDDARGELIQALVALHTADRFGPACNATPHACPCLPDVIAPVGIALADDQYHLAGATLLVAAVALYPDAPDAVATGCAYVNAAAQDADPHRAIRAGNAADALAKQFGAAWQCTWSAPTEIAPGTPAHLVADRFPRELVERCNDRLAHGGLTIDLAITGVAVTRATAVGSTMSATVTACVADALARRRWSGLDGRTVRIPIRFD